MVSVHGQYQWQPQYHIKTITTKTTTVAEYHGEDDSGRLRSRTRTPHPTGDGCGTPRSDWLVQNRKCACVYVCAFCKWVPPTFTHMPYCGPRISGGVGEIRSKSIGLVGRGDDLGTRRVVTGGVWVKGGTCWMQSFYHHSLPLNVIL